MPRHLEELPRHHGAHDSTVPGPDAALPTSALHLPASGTSASSTVPGLPKQASNIALSIPSRFLRLAARAAIPTVVADARGRSQTGAAQTGTRLRLRRHNHGQHLFMRVNSGYPVGRKVPPGGAESVPQLTLSRVAGYRRSPQTERQRPFIRLTTHAPDQTRRQPRLRHCWDDLAAPNLLLFWFPRSHFHELSRAARPY
jgi:hypothetical protein